MTQSNRSSEPGNPVRIGDSYAAVSDYAGSHFGAGCDLPQESESQSLGNKGEGENRRFEVRSPNI
jgi:hypothetical protein